MDEQQPGINLKGDEKMEQNIIEEGMKLPEFTLEGTDGSMHSPSEYSGKKLILYFYPKDNTAG
jgi:peroxiredoxin